MFFIRVEISALPIMMDILPATMFYKEMLISEPEEKGYVTPSYSDCAYCTTNNKAW